MTAQISQVVREGQLEPARGDSRVVEPGGQSESLELVRTEDDREWLHKRYSSPIGAGDPANERLRRLVAWRLRLDAADRAFLDARAAWPHAVVCADGDWETVVGVLMPAAPRAFWCSCTDPDEESPRHLDELFRDAEIARRHRQEFFNVPDKLARLGHLHELMAFLHRHDVVLGDVNAFNVLITGPSSPPAVYLVDCDSVHLGGVGAFPLAQVETMIPDPPPPRWPDDDVTAETDAAKFALLIVRSLQESAAAYDFRDGQHVWLPDRHRRRLRAVLHMLDAGADAQSLNSVTAGWKGCSDGRGNYRIRDAEKLVAPWTGPASVALDGWGSADAPRPPGPPPSGDAAVADPPPPPPPDVRHRRVVLGVIIGLVLIILIILVALDRSSSVDEPDSGAAPAVGSITSGATLYVPDVASNTQDGAGQTITFGPDNIWDGNDETCWRMVGNGTGSTITIDLPEPRTVTSLGLVNGYAKVDATTGVDQYTQERRITQVTWSMGSADYVQTLADGDREMQSVEIDPVVTDKIVLHIDATAPPGDATFDYTAISELEVLGELSA